MEVVTVKVLIPLTMTLQLTQQTGLLLMVNLTLNSMLMRVGGQNLMVHQFVIGIVGLLELLNLEN